VDPFAVQGPVLRGDPGTTNNPWSHRKLRGFLPAVGEF
jgi:hypothetical protein